MENEEALMENENNSNVESESFKSKIAEALASEDSSKGAPVLSDVTSSTDFVGVLGTDSPLGLTSAPEAPDVDSNGSFVRLSGEENNLHCQESVDSSHVEDLTQQAVLSSTADAEIMDYEDFIDAEDSQQRDPNVCNDSSLFLQNETSLKQGENSLGIEEVNKVQHASEESVLNFGGLVTSCVSTSDKSEDVKQSEDEAVNLDDEISLLEDDTPPASVHNCDDSSALTGASQLTNVQDSSSLTAGMDHGFQVPTELSEQEADRVSEDAEPEDMLAVNEEAGAASNEQLEPEHTDNHPMDSHTDSNPLESHSLLDEVNAESSILEEDKTPEQTEVVDQSREVNIETSHAQVNTIDDGDKNLGKSIPSNDIEEIGSDSFEQVKIMEECSEEQDNVKENVEATAQVENTGISNDASLLVSSDSSDINELGTPAETTLVQDEQEPMEASSVDTAVVHELTDEVPLLNSDVAAMLHEANSEEANLPIIESQNNPGESAESTDTTLPASISKDAEVDSPSLINSRPKREVRRTRKLLESDSRLMADAEIKKESNTPDSHGHTASSSVGSNDSVNIKQEPEMEAVDDSEEDVVVIDDAGELMPLKKEVREAQTSGKELNGHVSSLAVQQQQQQQLQQPSAAEKNKVKPANEGNVNHKYAVKGSKQKSADKEDQGLKAKVKLQTCLVCQKVCRCKYNIVRNGDIKHLCDDACFQQFRKSPAAYLKAKNSRKSTAETTNTHTDSQAVQPGAAAKPNAACKVCAVCQLMDMNSQQPFCNWKGLDFCGETCLGKFQGGLNTTCSFCHTYIPVQNRTAICLKIGNDMRSFCKQKCYNEFKKKLRMCSFCQKDVSGVTSSFTAIVGTDGRFRDFCSQACLQKMESHVNNVEVLSVEKGSLQLEKITCSVCKRQGHMKYTAKLQNEVNKLCSDLCLSAFQYTNKINMGMCDHCGIPCLNEEAQAHSIQSEGRLKRFCSDSCVSGFRKVNSKVMPCAWCSTKKLNFDMIERLDVENKVQLFCSLNCLSLYRVNLQAKSNQAVVCDQCQKIVPAQYHLTMSDATVRNFCSYPCVMNFQVQFSSPHGVSPFGSGSAAASSPATTPSSSQKQSTTPSSGRGRGRGGKMTTRQATANEQTPAYPVISSVVSLAPQTAVDQPVATVPVISIAPPALHPSPSVAAQALPGQTLAASDSMMTSSDGKHQVIIQAPPPVNCKNKSMQCRPVMQTKATSCRPHSQTKETQTDDIPVKSVIVPVPVPVYVPMPTVMFAAPTPKLVPFPIPIPVPIFIPTTRKSVNGITKAIKDIVERIPADPLEAELLMMAEAVAADQKSDDEDSDTDDYDATADDLPFTGDFDILKSGLNADDSLLMKANDEDMVQMALRMAEEMSGPIEDLETSVKPVAVNNKEPTLPQQPKNVEVIYTREEEYEDDEYIPPQSIKTRGGKRSRGRPPSSRQKRQRLDKSYEEDSLQPQLQSQPVEPAPDANYHLKFTYGVNAWRHWVISKNMQIEKTAKSSGGIKPRLFPTDILKCTMEDLNASLCLFVHEVRKPSGDLYSADSIFYLCLGIQQYLYENGRIDSIFSDTYFEKFTDCIHDILKTLQPKLNKQGQMLCRIEEEHLWESKQLGAHSPFVLLNTLVYFHTKYFILKTVEDHMSLSFAQILKHWKKGMPTKGQLSSAALKNVSLRYYCLAHNKKDGTLTKKSKEGVPVYEVTENADNPLRCPVKLYEFFLSKCPESIKNRNDIFYPVPERSCVPDSPVWYSTQPLEAYILDKMLTRILLVREIQEAHIHAQPIYL